MAQYITLSGAHCDLLYRFTRFSLVAKYIALLGPHYGLLYNLIRSLLRLSMQPKQVFIMTYYAPYQVFIVNCYVALLIRYL